MGSPECGGLATALLATSIFGLADKTSCSCLRILRKGSGCSGSSLRSFSQMLQAHSERRELLRTFSRQS